MSDSPFAECDICRKSFSGPEPFNEHLSSKAHEKKMVESRKKMMYTPVTPEEEAESGKIRCQVCNVSMTGEKALKQHESGSKHLSNLKKQNIMSNIKLDENVASVDHNGVLKCEPCSKSFSGPESYQQHLKSKKHARKMELLNMKSQLNGGAVPSCPPPTEADPNVPQGRLYPDLGDDYKIVHQEIQNRGQAAVDDKTKPGCFSFKKIFKKEKKEDKKQKNKP